MRCLTSSGAFNNYIQTAYQRCLSIWKMVHQYLHRCHMYMYPLSVTVGMAYSLSRKFKHRNETAEKLALVLNMFPGFML